MSSLTSYPSADIGPDPVTNVVDLELERARVGRDGLEGFNWPIKLNEHKIMRDACAIPLCAAAREAAQDGTAYGEAFSLLPFYICIDAVQVFYAHLVETRYRENGCEILPPDRARLYRRGGSEPAPPRILSQLRDGPPRPKLLRAPLRFGRDLAVQGAIRRRRLRGPDFAEDIISISIEPLCEAHAAAQPEMVTFQRNHEWFPSTPAGPAEIRVNPERDKWVARTLDAIDEGFRAAGETLSGELAQYFRSWVGEAIEHVARHQHALQDASLPLPKRLWTGTAGVIWPRILRHAVRQDGGFVTGHDHGSSNGHVVGEIFKTLVEFDTCDRFITYTEKQADGTRAAIAPELLVWPHDVEVSSVSSMTGGVAGISPSGTSSDWAQRHKREKKIRDVMYLSSFYFGDRVTMESFIADPVLIDFEARLLAAMKHAGLSVYYKPHPTIGTRPPADFAKDLGAEELNEPSEQVLHRAKVLITLDPMSTAFFTTLDSGAPTVFIDFGLFQLSEDARAHLAKRCVIVPGHFDNENRAQIEWDELERAIATAPTLQDTGFVDNYLRSAG